MEDATRKNVIFLAIALVAVLMGVALGVGLIMAWPKLGGPKPQPTETQSCRLDPESAAALAAVRAAAETSQEELDSLRVVIADLIDRMESRPSAGGGGPDNLPPGYVRQVNDFFNTATARSLLSSRISGAVKMGDPSFVDWDIITVPYTVSGKTHFLLVKIKILDFYDLQFDVLWDSLEGAR